MNENWVDDVWVEATRMRNEAFKGGRAPSRKKFFRKRILIGLVGGLILVASVVSTAFFLTACNGSNPEFSQGCQTAVYEAWMGNVIDLYKDAGFTVIDTADGDMRILKVVSSGNGASETVNIVLHPTAPESITTYTSLIAIPTLEVLRDGRIVVSGSASGGGTPKAMDMYRAAMLKRDNPLLYWIVTEVRDAYIKAGFEVTDSQGVNYRGFTANRLAGANFQSVTVRMYDTEMYALLSYFAFSAVPQNEVIRDGRIIVAGNAQSALDIFLLLLASRD